MERRVEHEDMWHVGKGFPREADAENIGRVVERCQVRNGLDPGDDVIGCQHGSGEAFAAMGDTVPDRGDRAKQFEIPEDLEQGGRWPCGDRRRRAL